MSSLNCWAELVILAMRGDSECAGSLIKLKLLILRPLLLIESSDMCLKWLALVALLGVLLAAECPPDAEEFLVTFHPHLDAFWLDTDDDLKNINFRPAGFLYAMNQRNSKTILNSMLDALTRNATRKYFVSEVVFFKDWYDYLSADQKKEVKKLFEKGQLDLANGGWVENDEAVCYVDDIIDQYTIGHNFLYSEFDVTTKIGWATDSFGHSHSQVAIQHLLGFEFQGIERIDDRYIYERNDGPLLEFYWSAVSDSNGRKYGGVMTLVRHFLHEVNDLRNAITEGIQMDFGNLEKNMLRLYKKNKLFRFLGNDFEEFVTDEFVRLENAFKTMNEGKGECPVYKYGNPIDYLDLIKKYYHDSTPIREHDFIPNYDQDHYWSGYYTTNPELKKICKDFSRLVNLFRKVYAKHLSAGNADNGNNRNLLRESDQLLSVMQHHDGITATSKYHIEETFKERMKAKSALLINAISELKQVPHQSCNFYQNNNFCSLNSQEDAIYLSIIHEGAPKKERVEIGLPASVTYDIFDESDDQIFCDPKTTVCRIVFEPKLMSGQNVFLLKKTESNDNKVKVQRATGGNYKDDDITLSTTGTQFGYSFNKEEEFIKISYVQAPNRIGGTTTYTWDKYGNRINKNEGRMAGIYIMANSGQINELKFTFNQMTVLRGKLYSKVYLDSNNVNVVVTFKNSELNVIDLQTFFKPQSRELVDYFIKVETRINSNGQFYHDSNGYLVKKRKVGERPDYKWDYKPEDKINANNYPMCSFAYAISADKKLVIFTDRAQGIAQYDTAYLINIDRLTGDDYKGVGEGYNNIIDNNFHHKIGLFSKSSHIEREWQRAFDEPLVGYYSNVKRETSAKGLITDYSKYLKYTVFLLNEDEFVLRLFNLGEKDNLELPIHTAKSWTISELGLDLKYAGISESFANGLPFSERRSWNKVEGEVNMFNAGAQDSPEKIVLAPLQVRSFRINLKNELAGPAVQTQHQSSKLELTLTEVTPVVKAFAKRCF